MDVSELLAEEVCPCLLHNCNLKYKTGESISGHSAIESKIVALYFTSNWCEPCHTFTKVLSQAHRAMEKRASELAVVNVPIESDPEQAKYTYRSMPSHWFIISPDNQHIKDLISKYNVRTVPKLIVCTSDGTPISYKGRSDIESKLVVAVYNWIDAAKPKPSKPTEQEEVNDSPNDGQTTI
ncbi:nucleoredoxin-like protein 2 [Watersipora subatra]|uniref:nucleoredoxin-like protein 2 n=1 Tax=Watersipora subatra TaxID=2589382 RepID=UPI00355BA04D